MPGIGQRNIRLGVPKVQQPKPPGLQKPKGFGKAWNAYTNSTAVSTPATTTAQPSNTVPATQSTPVDPMANAPAPTLSGNYADYFKLPTLTYADPKEDPRDATYWANSFKLKAADEQAYGKALLEQTRADTDYGDALQTAIRNRAVQQRGLGEDAIRGNLGASGWLDRNESEQTTAYTQERSHAARNKEEEDQDREAAKAALVQNFGLDLGSLLAESGDRYGQRSREEAREKPPPTEGGGPAAEASGGGASGSAPVGGKWAFYATPGDLPDHKKNDNPAKEAIAKKRRKA